jgi:hypothetical protein
MWLLGGIPVSEWTPELALEFMDAHGIALQVLSVSDDLSNRKGGEGCS